MRGYDSDLVLTLFCNERDSSAKGIWTARTNHMLVLKGSRISPDITPGFPTSKPFSYYELRVFLTTNGTIVDNVFRTDYRFKSPSEASAVIGGHSSNGNEDWYGEDNRSLLNHKADHGLPPRP